MNLAEMKQRLEAAELARGAADVLQASVREDGEPSGKKFLVTCVCGARWDKWKPRDELHELGCPADELRNIASALEEPLRRAAAGLEAR